MTTPTRPSALVTGGSSGLGLALVRRLAGTGWRVVTDARDGDRLATATAGLDVERVPGDVADPDHRAALAGRASGGLDLLVLGASTLGPLPMRELAAYGDDLAPVLTDVLVTNAVANADLLRRLTEALRLRAGVAVAISSDAGVAHYDGWGPYGASKAALDHLVLTTAAETGLHVYALDPGDMRTPMHADAFPGEDIGDRPLPDTVVDPLLRLVDRRPGSGRVTLADLAVPA